MSDLPDSELLEDYMTSGGETDMPLGPRVPAVYTPDDDVNPVCGCHRRSQCVGCGTCTSCDACYCGED